MTSLLAAVVATCAPPILLKISRLLNAEITALVEVQPDMAEVRGIALGRQAVVEPHCAALAGQTTSSLPAVVAVADIR
jgi:hypothetical protein